MQQKEQSTFRDTLRRIFGRILVILKKIGLFIRKIYYKIFPKRESRYYDANKHEGKYLLLMALSAVLINLYMEEFARITTGVFEGFRWALTHPLIFLFNTLFIFTSMTLALLFRRRRFFWFIIGLLWVALGTINGGILLSRMTPFTLYDLQNVADGLTIATTYYSMTQITLAIIVVGLLIAAIILIFIRSRKWKNISYLRSIAVILISALVTAGATVGMIRSGRVDTFFGNLNYAYRDYGLAYCFLTTSDRKSTR